MNTRQKLITNFIRKIIIENWDLGKEVSIKEIAQRVNIFLKQNNNIFTITPKLVGSYLRRFLKIETERRGHNKNFFPILTNEIVNGLRKIDF